MRGHRAIVGMCNIQPKLILTSEPNLEVKRSNDPSFVLRVRKASHSVMCARSHAWVGNWRADCFSHFTIKTTRTRDAAGRSDRRRPHPRSSNAEAQKAGKQQGSKAQQANGPQLTRVTGRYLTLQLRVPTPLLFIRSLQFRLALGNTDHFPCIQQCSKSRVDRRAHHARALPRTRTAEPIL